MNLSYTIARYEEVSGEFLVAFNVISDNNDSAYVESYLTLEEIKEKTSQEICQLAYEKVKVKIELLKKKFETNSVSVVGYQFIPVE
jgi:hypothetical protein